MKPGVLIGYPAIGHSPSIVHSSLTTPGTVAQIPQEKPFIYTNGRILRVAEYGLSLLS
jgi:hypothetical protein